MSGDAVVYKLRDINRSLVEAWQTQFSDFQPQVQISCGDIFNGAPAADAIVSPANSFGFMDGGIDQVYTNYFGKQMQRRLQEVIKRDRNGELLVGDAVIIPAYEKPTDYQSEPGYNEGRPIAWLISAPTMRVPLEVNNTANAYLAFRATILAVQQHNKQADKTPIRSVLCPGLATAVGKMSPDRCAFQMKEAFRVFELHDEEAENLRNPQYLTDVWCHHEKMMAMSDARHSVLRCQIATHSVTNRAIHDITT